MRKITLLIICIAGFVFADWMKILGRSESPLPPKKVVMATDSLFVFVRNENFGFIREDTTVDLETFQRIKIPEEALDYDTLNIGKPQIPYIKLLIAVPDSADFDITIYPTGYTLFGDYLLYPVPEIVFESDTAGYVYPTEIFTYDAFFYQKDTIYPGKLYEIKKDGHWRDQRVLEVFLYPVQFNPYQRKMYFYTGFDIRIEYQGEIIENTTGLGPFEDLGPDILLNYSGGGPGTKDNLSPSIHYYTDLLNPENVADYIIVTHYNILNNKTAQQWIYDFAQWRVDHNHFDVGIVDIIDIYDQFDDSLPDSARALKEFLIYAYDNWHAPSMTDDHFAYCLFIGDWDYVPAKLRDDGHIVVWADEGYFRSLTSPSDWDDIMLGRWPVKAATGSDIENLVTIAQKTINYEKYPDTGDWRRDGLLIAGHNDVHWDFDSFVDVSKGYFSDISYDTFTVYRSDFTPESGPSTPFFDSISYYLNQGEILAIYFDHGSTTAWYHYDTTRVKLLENGNRLPVVLAFACYTASFQWNHPESGGSGCTCFGEHFIFNKNGGCVAYYGATTGAGTDVVGIIERILRYQNWILGKGIFGFSSRRYCLLGDPALDLGDYTAYPDLPDLVVRPQGIDISLLSPYPNIGDTIPIRVRVWNIGGATAHNVEVEFTIKAQGGYIIIFPHIIIPEISPRDTAVVVFYWDPSHIFSDYGEIGDCEFIVEVDPDNLINESWEYNNQSLIVKKVALYPNQPGWPKKITGCSQPAIGDVVPVLGLASVEVICPGFDSVYVFDINGDNPYGWPQYFPEVHSVVLGDINNDTYLEIIAVSFDSVKVYNWEGNILWARKVPDFGPPDNYPCYIMRPPSLGRIANVSSRYLDVVIIGESDTESYWGPFKVLVYDYNGDSLYGFESDFNVEFGINVNPSSISDINGDGKVEIVVTSGLTVTIAEYGFTSIFNKDGLVDTFNYGSGFMTPALADLDDDNYPEIISGGYDKKIRAYNAVIEEILWETETGGAIHSSPAVGNINPLPQFPGNEIAFGNDTSRVFAIKGSDGEWWFPWWLETGGKVQTSPALANIDNNPGLDIIIGANDQYIYALDYNTDSIPPFPLPLFGQPSSPIIGDIDRDGKSETILSSSDGYLHVWNNMNSSVPILNLEWPQFHHDYQRTGLYGWVPGKIKVKLSLQEFSTATTISCSLSANLNTQITIYNSQGEIVKTLMNQELSTGDHQFDWDGTDDNNNLLPNGSYIIELKTEQGVETIPVEINR